MAQRAFVSLTSQGALPFNAEEFTDVNELRALADLIGPYGMKLLNETLVWEAAREVADLKKLVLINKDVLLGLRTNFDKPEEMKELTKRLVNADLLLTRMINVGIVLCFRNLTQQALQHTLKDRIPFLLSSVGDIKKDRENFPDMVGGGGETNPSLCGIVDDMASAAGIKCRIDPLLVHALRGSLAQAMQKPDGTPAPPVNPDDDYLLSCLLMVFVAVSIPQLARLPGSQFRPDLEAHLNNMHCLATSVNEVFGALFSMYSHYQADIEDRLKEFLALASSSLLR
jgi:NCK-associated protein 1